MPHSASFDGPDPSSRGDETRTLAHFDDVVQDFLSDLVQIAATGLGDGMSAAVILAVPGHAVTRAGSDERATQVEAVEHAVGEGPCLSAMETLTDLVVGDLASDPRFGTYGPRARARDVRSCVSLPLIDTQRGRIGVLTVYSRHPNSFGRQQQAMARRFADEAARALSLVLDLAQLLTTNAQLRFALSARTTIDQAIGIVMYLYQADAEVALALLVATSRDRNVALAVVAAEVAAAASAPTEGI